MHSLWKLRDLLNICEAPVAYRFVGGTHWEFLTVLGTLKTLLRPLTSFKILSNPSAPSHDLQYSVKSFCAFSRPSKSCQILLHPLTRLHLLTPAAPSHANYDRRCTGYMGSITVLEAIADVMQKMKAANDGHVTYGEENQLGDAWCSRLLSCAEFSRAVHFIWPPSGIQRVLLRTLCCERSDGSMQKLECGVWG